MDNPWVPLYCCFTAIWAIVFLSGWKRLEQAYQYEWDTRAFEGVHVCMYVCTHVFHLFV